MCPFSKSAEKETDTVSELTLEALAATARSQTDSAIPEDTGGFQSLRNLATLQFALIQGLELAGIEGYIEYDAATKDLAPKLIFKTKDGLSGETTFKRSYQNGGWGWASYVKVTDNSTDERVITDYADLNISIGDAIDGARNARFVPLPA